MKAPPAAIMQRTGRNGRGEQLYTLVAIEACTTQNGRRGALCRLVQLLLGLWRAVLHHITSPCSFAKTRRLLSSRNCPRHRRTSTPGAAAKAAALAERYGTADPDPLEPIRRRAGAMKEPAS